MTKTHNTTRTEIEKKHFEEVVSKLGYSWWGVRTPAAKQRIKRRVELIKKYLELAPGSKILECGCGTGELTLELSNNIGNDTVIYALDIVESLIQHASKNTQKKNVRFITGDIVRSGFCDNSFNYVIGNGILHHLDLEIAIKEFKRILKPGGGILFFEPNMANPQIWLQFNVPLFRKVTRMSPDEKTFWRWEIKKYLSSFGLKNIMIKPFDFIHPLIPEKLLTTFKTLELILEKTPIREIAGSLLIYAEV